MPEPHRAASVQLRLVQSTNIPDPAPFARLVERKINRAVLIDISPDREAILKTASIEEIRQKLAIKVMVSATEQHWLHQVNLGSGSTIAPESDYAARRILSSGRIEDEASLYRILRLDSPKQLISPRPLGPTHILVATEAPKASSRPRATGSADQAASLSFLEVPVNDLLFALNVPNLACRIVDGVEVRPLPQRVQYELPRVRMTIPHLRTFPELVVYLHTKDQVELFRKMVPEWVRDLMDPVPSVGYMQPAATGRASNATLRSQWLTLPGKSNGLLGSEDRRLIESYLQSKAGELANMVQERYDGRLLVEVKNNLDFLRNNLLHLGYYCQDLWFELDLTREILLRSLVLYSKMESR